MYYFGSFIIETVSGTAGGSVEGGAFGMTGKVEGESVCVQARTRHIVVTYSICSGSNSEGCHDVMTVVG